MTTAVGSFSFTSRLGIKIRTHTTTSEWYMYKVYSRNKCFRSYTAESMYSNMLLHCQETPPCIELPVSAEVVTAENSNFVVY